METTGNCDTQEDLGYLTLPSVSQNASQLSVTHSSNVSSLVDDSVLGNDEASPRKRRKPCFVPRSQYVSFFKNFEMKLIIHYYKLLKLF